MHACKMSVTLLPMSNTDDRVGARAVARFIQASIGDEKISNWAEANGLSASLMSRWKNGRTTTPKIDQLRLVADALGRDLNELLAVAGISETEDDLPEPAPAPTPEDLILLDPRFDEQTKRTLLGMIQIATHTPKP